jgi:hypothetical protein
VNQSLFSVGMIWLIIICKAAFGEAPESFTVCEILRNLPKYADKDVEIKGEWIQTYHGTTVRATCAEQLRTGDHLWPNAIWVQFPWLEEENPVDFTADKDGLQRARNEGRKSSPDDVVLATFIGRLQARERLQVTRRKDGTTVVNGFGHLNAYPAQLVVRSITRVTVRKNR